MYTLHPSRYMRRPYFKNAQDMSGQKIILDNSTNGVSREYFVTFRFSSYAFCYSFHLIT